MGFIAQNDNEKLPIATCDEIKPGAWRVSCLLPGNLLQLSCDTGAPTEAASVKPRGTLQRSDCPVLKEAPAERSRLIALHRGCCNCAGKGIARAVGSASQSAAGI
eukprot:634291-Amphidinium_carterae.1